MFLKTEVGSIICEPKRTKNDKAPEAKLETKPNNNMQLISNILFDSAPGASSLIFYFTYIDS